MFNTSLIGKMHKNDMIFELFGLLCSQYSSDFQKWGTKLKLTEFVTLSIPWIN